MKKIFVILVLIMVSLSSCKYNNKKDAPLTTLAYQCPMKCEGDKTVDKPGICPICKMNLAQIATRKVIDTKNISNNSIFNLTSKWNTEEGKKIQLIDLKGSPLVLVMFYSNCKTACPRLVADMRNIEKQIPKSKNVKYIMVSIDPENDNPKRLKEFAIENQMDGKQWTFLQGTPSGVREFANVLSVRYKEISPLNFSHSNIISVFNPKGELIHQKEGLGINNLETVNKIKELVGL